MRGVRKGHTTARGTPQRGPVSCPAAFMASIASAAASDCMHSCVLSRAGSSGQGAWSSSKLAKILQACAGDSCAQQGSSMCLAGASQLQEHLGNVHVLERIQTCVAVSVQPGVQALQVGARCDLPSTSMFTQYQNADWRFSMADGGMALHICCGCATCRSVAACAAAVLCLPA